MTATDQTAKVARILGWEYSTVSEWGDMGWWRPDDPDAPPLPEPVRPYDESDLANYLADCGLWVAIGNAYDGEGGMNEWDVTVSSVHGDGYNEPAVDHVEAATAGPTLLAALEAAVLAVAGDEVSE